MRTSTKKEYPLATAVSALPSFAAQRPPDSPRSRARRRSVDQVVQDEGGAWKSPGRRSKPGVGTTYGARRATQNVGEGDAPDLGGAVVPHGGGTHLLGPVAEVVEQGSSRR